MNTPAPTDLVRTISVDATPRATAADVTMGPLFLRIDATHELPIVVEDGRGHTIARFARSGDAAIFAARDHQSLPAEFLLRFHDEVGGL